MKYGICTYVLIEMQACIKSIDIFVDTNLGRCDVISLFMRLPSIYIATLSLILRV